jgi:hypothetical protein
VAEVDVEKLSVPTPKAPETLPTSTLRAVAVRTSTVTVKLLPMVTSSEPVGTWAGLQVEALDQLPLRMLRMDVAETAVENTAAVKHPRSTRK